MPADVGLFDDTVWRQALEKLGAATHLTLVVHGADGEAIGRPIHPTPLFELLTSGGYDPGILAECARQCLAQTDARPAVVLAPAYGLAVVGTSLALDGRVMGAAVAAYALVDFTQRSEIERLAHAAGVPFRALWEVTRVLQPVPERRLGLHGELLQVLGDTVLRELQRARQAEETAAGLAVVAATKDEFLAVVSHELRTPLTPILGWARMLKRGDPARVAQAAEVIERNALLQLRMVEDLLELTRTTRGDVTVEMRTCNLGEAVCFAHEAVAESAQRKGIALAMIPVDPPLFVKADANRLQQVLRNVLSNAVKFTPAGGQITVALMADAGSAVLTVRDTGEGIAPEFLPFVFDIFRQQEHGARRTHEGLGIGLALVKRLTELQEGRVAIASDGPGRGTEVTIRFPILEHAVDASPGTPSVTVVDRDLHGLRILVVEDADDAREFTRELLEQLGANVLVARDGIEALAIVALGHLDVVLCDLWMPRMDGFGLMQALRSDPATTPPPVIAVSGLASSADHLRTQAAGFEGHLNKPYDETDLIAAVGAAVARRAIRSGSPKVT